MRLRLLAPCLMIGWLASAVVAAAAPVPIQNFDLVVGDTVRITFLQGGFRVTELQNPDTDNLPPSPDPAADFATFCLVNNAPISDGGIYTVFAFQSDIQFATAHLYQLFTDNELPTALHPPNFGPPLPQLNTTIQPAVYFLEGQPQGLNNDFAQCALGNLTANGQTNLLLTPSDCTVPTGIGDIRRLVLKTAAGGLVQDLLIRVPGGPSGREIPDVPEPGSMLLLGTGLFAVTTSVRRQRVRRR